MAYQDFINAVPKRHRETVCNWVDTQIALGVRNTNVLAQIARCIADELAHAYFHQDDRDDYWEICVLFDCDPEDAREFAAMRLLAFDPTKSTSQARDKTATREPAQAGTGKTKAVQVMHGATQLPQTRPIP